MIRKKVEDFDKNVIKVGEIVIECCGGGSGFKTGQVLLRRVGRKGYMVQFVGSKCHFLVNKGRWDKSNGSEKM